MHGWDVAEATGAARRCPRTSRCGCTTSRWPWSPRTSAAALRAPVAVPRPRPPAPACCAPRPGRPGRSVDATTAAGAPGTGRAQWSDGADARDRRPGGAAARPGRRRHHPGGRRRHLHLHPGAAQRRQLGAGEDPGQRPRRLLRDRGARPALAGRARRRRRRRGARRRARLPGAALGRARPADPGERRRARAARSPRLHASGADEFGAEQDGFIGSLPLPNRTAPTWPEFYAAGGCCPTSSSPPTGATSSPPTSATVEALVGRLTDLAGPEEPPARIHGDLWSGNIVWSAEHGTLIDPAAHGGHRETDLAMLALFGCPTCSGSSTPTRRRPRWPTAGRSASPCTSCSRCSCTPPCSAATTASAPARPLARALTPADTLSTFRVVSAIAQGQMAPLCP